MHYVACRTAGHSVFGPPPDDLIGPIARADILAYLADELTGVWPTPRRLRRSQRVPGPFVPV